MSETNSVNTEKIYPLSPAQERVLAETLLSDDSSVYNMVSVMRVRDRLKDDCIVSAFRLLGVRYPVLRTAICLNGDVGGQYIDENRVVECDVCSADSVDEYLSQETSFRFDLRSDNLFHARVVHCKDCDRVIENAHHIILDGFSYYLVNKTLIEYNDLLSSGVPFEEVKSKAEQGAAADMSFEEYVRSVSLKNVSAAKDYWAGLMDGYEGGEIKPRPSVCSDIRGRAGSSFRMSDETFSRVKEFCQNNLITVSVFAKAVWGILLNKYSYADDIVFGDAVSGRARGKKELKNAVGLFFNVLPVRLDLRSDRQVKDVFSDLRTQQVKGSAYGYLSLAETMAASDSASVGTFFNYMPQDIYYYSRDDAYRMDKIVNYSGYDLEWYINCDKEFVFELIYNTGLYSEKDIKRLSERIFAVVEFLLDHPDCTVAQVEALTEEDKKALARFNDRKYPFDETETVVDRFERQAKKTPERVAVAYYDRALTYRELDEKSDAVAAFLRGKGVKKGDVVALCLRRSPEMIASIFGALKAGAVYLPLDESYPQERFDFVLKDSGAKLVLTDGTAAKSEFPTFDVRDLPAASKSRTPLMGTDRAYVIYTSGTTGKPKGVITLHKGLSNLLLSYEKIYGLTENDVVLQVASYTFDQSVWDIFGVLCVGGKLALISYDDVRDPEAIAKRCEQERVTIASFTPAMIAELDPTAFPSLRILDSSGEAASPAVLKKWVDKVRVVNTYGPTEYTVNSCSYDYTGAETESVPIGGPILNTEFFVRDKGGALCGTGMCGELCIAGAGIAEGYLNRPELTEKKFVPSFSGNGKMYRTGDLVCWNERGDIEFIDRIDSQVKIRGYRIELGEIDNALRQVLGLKDCFVRVIERAGAKAIAAYVVGDAPVSDVRQELQSCLPGYMVPQYFVSIDRIPRGVSGKVDKKALPDVAVSGPEKTAPITTKEKILAVCWEEVLGERAFCEDDFVECGGDSIKAIRLSAKAFSAGISLSVKQIMREKIFSRMAEAAEFLQEKNETNAEGVSAREIAYAEIKYGKNNIEKIYRLTPLQEGMLYRSLYDADSSEYKTQIVMEMPALDQNVFFAALDLVTLRHEVIRTAFLYTERGGLQVILKDRKPEISSVIGNVKEIAEKDRSRAFDIEKDSLCRITCVRDGDKNYLIQSSHHLIVDGWSSTLLMAAVETYYKRLLSGEKYEDLVSEIGREKKIKTSFKDFVDIILAKDATEATAHYKKLTDGFAGGTEYPSAGEKKPLGVAVERHADFPDLSDVVKKLRVTKAVLYQVAWGVVLGAADLSGDAMFGNVLSGRTERLDGVEEIVGMCINTVPVRVRYDVATTLADVIADVEKQNEDNAQYGFLPLSSVAKNIGTVTVFENHDERSSVTVKNIFDQTEYDLELQTTGEGSQSILRYNDRRYTTEEIDRLIRLMTGVFNAMKKDVSQLVKDIPLLTESEKEEYRTIKSRTPNIKNKSEFIPVKTEKEIVLATCVKKVLSVEPKNANDDFFDLGGDSISAIRLSAKLREEGYFLSVKDIMTGKTIAEMARRAAVWSGEDEPACGIVPLTPVMTDFFDRSYADPDGYVQEILLKFNKRFDRIREALQAVYEHHDMLRATFTGGKLIVPEVSESAPLSYDIYESDDVLKTCAEIKKKVKMSGPTFVAASIRRKDAEYLYLCAHHLVVDGVSWRVILEDISSGCAGERLPKKTASYLSWAKKCAAGVKISEKETDFWRRTEERITPVFTEKGNAPFSTGFSLSKEETRRIAENAGRIFGARRDVTMLAALARAAYRTFGKEETAVLMESHGRQPLFDDDISRTVGWFTSYYPVIFSGTGTEEECVTENKERLLSVPLGGVRYQFANKKNPPDIIFNYMGEYNFDNSPVKFYPLPVSEDNPEREALDVEGEINGGILNISLRFNGPSKEVGETLKENFRQELIRICAVCSDEKEKILSPADLGYPGMNMDDFAEVMKVDPVRIAPLTPTQQGMLFHSEDDKEEYLEQTAVRLPFTPDIAKVEKLLNALADKYAVFRTVYVLCKSGNIYQCVKGSAQIKLNKANDLSAVRNRRVKEGVSPFDGVPIRLDIVKDTLLITSHHILLDAWSEGVFIEEFEKLYSEDRLPEGREDVSFCEYASELPYSLFARDYDYWKNLAVGATSSLVPGHAAGVRGENKRRIKELFETDKVLLFARKNGVTENSVFEAAAALFMQIVCGKTDVIFGKVVSGRDARTANAVGLYISTVPVRVRSENAQDVLFEIDRQARALSEYAVCPLNEIFKRARLQDPIGMLFVYDSIERRAETKPLFVRDSTNYGITLAVSKEQKFIADISYNDGEYLPDEIDAFLSLYARCVDEITDGQEPFFTPLFGEKVSYPSSLTEIWKTHPDFTLTADKEYSAEEISRRAEILSGYLHSRFEKGIIGVRLERGVDMIVALLGIVLSGSAYMPIGVDYPEERVKYMVENADAKTVLDQKFMSSFRYDGPRYVADVDPEDVCYVIYTSGSTGRPKGAKISHRAIANRLCWMEKKYPLAGGAILQKTPYTFDVSVWDIFRPLLFGGRLVLTPPGLHADPKTIAGLVKKYSVSQAHFVPSVYDIYLEYCQTNEVAPIKDLFLSGEKLGKKTVEKHNAVFGKNSALHNLYGPTECAVDVTYYDLKGDESDVPIGKPVDNTEISVVSRGKVVPPYVEGEIVVGGVNVGSGYIGKIRGGFVGGKYYTGDIGWTDNDGNIHFVGRKDRQIKWNGMRIEPGEIEWQIGKIEGVKDVAVAVVGKNPMLSAFIVAEDKEKTEGEIKRRLPEYMTPTRRIYVDKIPLSENGKRDLAALSEVVEKGPSLPRAAKTILDAVEETAGKKIGYDTPFEEAGIGSLERIRLSVKLAPLGFTFADLVRANSVRELYLREHNEYFMKFAGGNDKAVICIPYAGGTARIYKDLSPSGYDVYAAVGCTFDEKDWPAVIKEVKRIKTEYKRVVLYAHCLGSMTALKLAREVEFDLIVFGAHVPDAVSSFFGRPIDSWKHTSDKNILATLEKGGLKRGETDFAPLFRKDASRAARIEAEKPVVSLPAVLLLAEKDPFASSQKAEKRWKKFLTGPIKKITLTGKDHYFISDKDFGDILLKAAEEENE